MDVRMAEQQILLIGDRIGTEEADARAHSKRNDAFGTMAKLTGFLGRGKEDAVELVYRERRLQPFWRIAATAVCAYDRRRAHTVTVGAEVRTATIGDMPVPVEGGTLVVTVHEVCREESAKTVFHDALTGQESTALAALMEFAPTPVDAELLAEHGRAGTVVVPPSVRASALTRELVAGMIGRIEADSIEEECVTVGSLELIYRPVNAYRYKRGDKLGVVEVDGLTGAATIGGSTFEHLMGKVMEPAFLLDFGVEAVNLFVPGARLAQIMVSKGVATHKAMTAKR